MTLKEYYSKDKHTRKEKAWYNKTMKKKYEKYKEEYHKAKIKFRTRTVEKYSFAAFKSAYEDEYMYRQSAGESVTQTLKSITTEENFRELSEYAYDTKRENLIRNQQKYQYKKDSGQALTQGEQLVLSVDAHGNIYKLVAYFDKLGLAHVAFDS